MSRILFDLEGNGFLHEISKIHCCACVDVDTGERRVFGPHETLSALDYLAGHTLIAHNGIGYDYPVLEKLYGFRVPEEKQLDTLVLARLIHPNVKDRDSDLNKKRLKHGEDTMAEEFGKHTLRAWGRRLRIPKADFEGPWDGWTQEMQDYCVQDVETNLRLWRFLDVDKYSRKAIELEHDVARLCRKITEAGWPFDEVKAGALHSRLVEKRDVLEKELIAEFKGWEEKTTFTPKVNNKARGYVKGVEFVKRKWIEFNPKSRQHVIRALVERGWKPHEFTDNGQAKLDEEVIESLASTFSNATQLVEYLTIDKRLGQLANGKQAWMKLVKDGKIHGDYNPMGTVTSRASHFNPNIGQVPSGSSPYGHECRELFTVLPGFVQLGADMTSLEGLCLAHYLAKYDDGEYGRMLRAGDPHWAVALALGLLPAGTARDKENTLHTMLREHGAKRGFYAMLYGAGDEKMGRVILDAIRAAIKSHPEAGEALLEKFFTCDAPGKKELRAVGAKAKHGVVHGIFGFSALKNNISEIFETRGSLPGLDGRRLPVRSEHSALNTLLQSAGAILCKRWIVDAYKGLIADGLRWSWQGDFVFLGWIHDELQIAVRAGLEERAATIVTAAARHSGEPYGFRIALDSAYKTGTSWAQTH